MQPAYHHDDRMKKKDGQVDFLIVGAGIAGLRAAMELAPDGRVLVLSKSGLYDSSTEHAQGGIAAALADDDEVCLHLRDTLLAGDGLCREEAVRILVEEGPGQIQKLMDWGMRFDHQGARLAFTREGAHSRSRILHAHGDSTGAEVVRALMTKVKSRSTVELRPHAFATDFLMESGRVAGISYIDTTHSTVHSIRATAVLLATGGLGQVYKETTNPEVACGDGVAMACRAGAMLSDLEFIQFHPTALYVKGAPRFLLSEALRGEGAVLRNIVLERFMPRYHEAGDLAPRDVVSRAIVMEMKKTASEFVYLDMTGLKGEYLKKRFPKIYSTCLQYNLDIADDLLPVRPAAHYAMGGVATDLDGATSLEGLYSAGEVAATGVHGANRLASNSLLEGLVFGARAAASMRQVQGNKRKTAVPSEGVQQVTAPVMVPVHPTSTPCVDPSKVAERVRSILWEKVGIIRDQAGLAEAVHELAALSLGNNIPAEPRYYEAQNILTIGRLIAMCALTRKESRGAHYRADIPFKESSQPPRHSYVSRNFAVSFSQDLPADFKRARTARCSS